MICTSQNTFFNLYSLCEGPFFYFYVESSSSKFTHQLREHSCHSECNVHSPWIIIDWLILLVFLVLKLLVPSHPLNSKGVLAFMFCSIIRDKPNTTLLCLLYTQTNKFLSMLYYSWSLFEILWTINQTKCASACALCIVLTLVLE